jgi:hypothetical protein
MSAPLLVLAAPEQGPARVIALVRRGVDGSAALLAEPAVEALPSGKPGAAEPGTTLGTLLAPSGGEQSAAWIDRVAHLEVLPLPGGPCPPDRRIDLWIVGPGRPAPGGPWWAPGGGRYRFESRRLAAPRGRAALLLLPAVDGQQPPEVLPFGPLPLGVRGTAEAVAEVLSGDLRRGGELEAWLAAPLEEGGAGLAAEQVPEALVAARELLGRLLAGEGAGTRRLEAGDLSLEPARSGDGLALAFTLEGVEGNASRHEVVTARFDGRRLGPLLDPEARSAIALVFEERAELGWTLVTANDARVHLLERLASLSEGDLMPLDDAPQRADAAGDAGESSP